METTFARTTSATQQLMNHVKTLSIVRLCRPGSRSLDGNVNRVEPCVIGRPAAPHGPGTPLRYCQEFQQSAIPNSPFAPQPGENRRPGTARLRYLRLLCLHKSTASDTAPYLASCSWSVPRKAGGKTIRGVRLLISLRIY